MSDQQDLFKRFVQPGRLVVPKFGECFDKPCVIVDIMTLKRVIVEGPEVKRQVMTLRRLQLTDFCLELSRGASSKDVKAALKEDNLVEKFYASAWGKKRQAFHKKRELTDFERFKVSRARSIISKKVAAA